MSEELNEQKLTLVKTQNTVKLDTPESPQLQSQDNKPEETVNISSSLPIIENSSQPVGINLSLSPSVSNNTGELKDTLQVKVVSSVSLDPDNDEKKPQVTELKIQENKKSSSSSSSDHTPSKQSTSFPASTTQYHQVSKKKSSSSSSSDHTPSKQNTNFPASTTQYHQASKKKSLSSSSSEETQKKDSHNTNNMSLIIEDPYQSNFQMPQYNEITISLIDPAAIEYQPPQARGKSIIEGSINICFDEKDSRTVAAIKSLIKTITSCCKVTMKDQHTFSIALDPTEQLPEGMLGTFMCQDMPCIKFANQQDRNIFMTMFGMSINNYNYTITIDRKDESIVQINTKFFKQYRQKYQQTLQILNTDDNNTITQTSLPLEEQKRQYNDITFSLSASPLHIKYQAPHGQTLGYIDVYFAKKDVKTFEAINAKLQTMELLPCKINKKGPNIFSIEISSKMMSPEGNMKIPFANFPELDNFTKMFGMPINYQTITANKENEFIVLQINPDFFKQSQKNDLTIPVINPDAIEYHPPKVLGKSKIEGFIDIRFNKNDARTVAAIKSLIKTITPCCEVTMKDQNTFSIVLSPAEQPPEGMLGTFMYKGIPCIKFANQQDRNIFMIMFGMPINNSTITINEDNESIVQINPEFFEQFQESHQQTSYVQIEVNTKSEDLQTSSRVERKPQLYFIPFYLDAPIHIQYQAQHGQSLGSIDIYFAKEDVHTIEAINAKLQTMELLPCKISKKGPNIFSIEIDPKMMRREGNMQIQFVNFEESKNFMKMFGMPINNRTITMNKGEGGFIIQINPDFFKQYQEQAVIEIPLEKGKGDKSTVTRSSYSPVFTESQQSQSLRRQNVAPNSKDEKEKETKEEPKGETKEPETTNCLVM